MNYLRSEIKVGVFVFISLSFLMFFVLSIGSFQLFQRTKNVVIFFDFVDGLEKNAPVRFSGVEIGKVKDIDVINDISELIDKDKRVRVVLRIDDDVKLNGVVRASVNTLGLLGEKYVELTLGPEDEESGKKFVKDGDVLLGEDIVRIKEILEIGKNIVKNLQSMTSNLNTVVSNNQGTFDDIIKKTDSIVNKLDGLLKNTDEIVADNKDDIQLLIKNLKDTAEYLKSFAEKIDKNPSRLMWKTREDKKAELEERRAAAKKQKKVLDDKGRAVSPRMAAK